VGTGSPYLAWTNALGGYSGNTTTCSYGNYANLQMAQMARQQQAHGDYWNRHAGLPGPEPAKSPSMVRMEKEAEAREQAELGRKRDAVLADILERHKPDPFRQLCNHDFHGLLDKFKGMRDGTAKA